MSSSTFTSRLSTTTGFVSRVTVQAPLISATSCRTPCGHTREAVAVGRLWGLIGLALPLSPFSTCVLCWPGNFTFFVLVGWLLSLALRLMMGRWCLLFSLNKINEKQKIHKTATAGCTARYWVLHGHFCLSYTYGLFLSDCRVDSSVGTLKAGGERFFPFSSFFLKTAIENHIYMSLYVFVAQ